MHTRLDPRKRVTIRAELEDYISWPQFKNTHSFTTGVYNDILLSVGIGIPISRAPKKQ